MASFLLADFLFESEEHEVGDDFVFVAGAALVSVLERETRIRIQGYVENVANNYSETDFRRIFRLTRPCFECLCMLLADCPEMQVRPAFYGGRERISLQKTVLIALRYLGHQGNMRIISDTFNVSDSTILVCRNRVCTAIVNNLKDRFIQWPTLHAETIAKFEEKGGFPGVLGAIDGTHIQIKAPENNPQDYVNRKSYHSLVLQAVCLTDMTFSHCFAGWPGSCHDSRVLRNSDLWEEAPLICGRYHILGDGAYPVKPWLLTPYRDNGHLTAVQRRYNYIHSATRTVIERSFAQLKGRFRRLQTLEIRNMQTAADVIIAACVLHNMCIANYDNADDLVEMDVGDNMDDFHAAVHGIDAAGVAKRDEISKTL